MFSDLGFPLWAIPVVWVAAMALWACLVAFLGR
jgi:hypothetical protein